MCVVAPKSGNRREVGALTYLLAFFMAVAAEVAGYYICKWLDRHNSDN